MASSISLLFLVVAFCCVVFATAGKVDSERKEIIDSAIAQVKREFSEMKHKKQSKVQERLRAFKVSTPETRAQGFASWKFERMVSVAEKKILQKQRKAKAQTTESLAEALAMELFHTPGSILTKEEVKVMFDESECFETLTSAPDCSGDLAQKHRLADGTCNNLENPTWGAAATAMRRLQPARYDDGWSRARGFLQSQSSFDLDPFKPPIPSPRIASIGVVQDRPDVDLEHTHILMQWGQFMDHDLDAMPEFEVECPEDCEITGELEGMCYPFAVPADDLEVMVTRVDPGSTGWHMFRRSLPACPEEGEIQPREQVNAITHFIDGSMVYHHDPTVQRNLIRDSQGGTLRVGPASPAEPGRPLLPDANPDDGLVLCPPDAEPCFLAGDLRVNEQSALTVMHTIWVREHNRVAQFIRANNPALTDDKVFNIARDIVTSEIQKITYQDFLPILIGTELIPSYTGYDNTVRPTVGNAFATAAYRYGHSQIQPFFDRLDGSYQPLEPLQLVDAFFDTTHVRDLGIDSLTRGLLKNNARRVDEFLNSILTNRLFASDADTPGLDLAGLNIQRGRDHGLAPYPIWKQWAKHVCGIESDFRNPLTELRLLQTYGSLDQVDLFVGGLAEAPLPGGLVGAVFGCIFADTFRSVRDGDRFYYENTDFFSAAQRNQIAQSSLSRVICDNTGVSEIQRNAFLANQARIPCSQIPGMDLSQFNVPSSGESLPNTCYAKVRNNGFIGAQEFVAASRRRSFGDFLVSRGPIAGSGEACYAFLCPVGSGESRLNVIPRNPQCDYIANSNLAPATLRPRFSHVYAQRLAAGDISPASGLYTSGDSCLRGSADAVTYTCQRGSVGKQNAAGTPVDEGSNKSEEELSDLVGSDVMSDINGARASSSSSADSKLEGLMSDLLHQLQATTSHKDTAAAAAAKAPKAAVFEQSHEVSDETLVSELEKILKKV